MNLYEKPSSTMNGRGNEESSTTTPGGIAEKLSSSGDRGGHYDLLRARLEVEVGQPAAIAITSSRAEDGKDILARGLAFSLAMTGYATLLVNTSSPASSLPRSPEALTLDEIARRQPAIEAGAGKSVVLTLDDPLFQKATNQRQVRAAFDIFRTKFDYVVLSTGCGCSNSLSVSVLSAADAVLVSLKLGRRQRREDLALRDDLRRIGSRFLGVVSIAPTLIDDPSMIVYPRSKESDVRRGHMSAHGPGDRQRREVAEWPT